MALRKIIKVPDDTLRKVCRPVDHIDSHILTLLDDMAQTMYANDGVGLAAPQVGILRQIVVIDIGDEDVGLLELINPKIISTEGEQIGQEGCLSVSDIRGAVKRPARVVVQAYDRNGDLMQYSGEGLLAVAFCHEIDHLNGIIFTDKMEKNNA